MNLIDSVRGIFSLPALSVAGWGFAVTFSACIFLVLTKRWHGFLSMDESEGIQKFHTAPTPRVGGIPIVLGVLVAWAMAGAEVQKMLLPVLMAGMPAFLFGLAEDLTKRVSVMKRLIATFASGVMAWWITDYSLGRVDVWGLDVLLQFTLVSVVFTAFAVGGVANAINIIDGFNGLASTASSLAFLGYGLIAYQVGDHTLASGSLVLAFCVWGFFWVNWPLGKIFLGDGGSYFVGFALAWVAVMLLDRNQSVSAFAVLLVCVHPVIEVVFSVYRRKIKRAHPGHPDRLHFHSLVKQRYVRRWFPSLSTGWRNSITGLLVGGMTLTSAVIGTLFYESLGLSVLAFVVLGLGYVAIYARMVRHHWCSPIEFLLVKPGKVFGTV
jgi:UDP-N-acetylmuramyl pentapeptide phosphotransferase/UDP-N-acetylglucosamine-1-phosphate transferase